MTTTKKVNVQNPSKVDEVQQPWNLLFQLLLPSESQLEVEELIKENNNYEPEK